MTRFVGLLLMVMTGAVVAPLATFALPGEDQAQIALGLTMAVLGLLFGFLATARHIFWALAASVVIVLSLASHWMEPARNNGPDRNPRSSSFQTSILVIPPVALIVFSAIGARLLHRREPRPGGPGEE